MTDHHELIDPDGVTALAPSSATVAQLAAADPDLAAPVIDRRLVFLGQATAQLLLIRLGELNLDEAFDDDDLMPAIREFADCRCDRAILANFDDATWQHDRGDHHRNEHDHEVAARNGQAATSTVEALKYELRSYGIDQLRNPRTQARIAELSVGQTTDLIAALRRMQSAYPLITDELVELLQQVRK